MTNSIESIDLQIKELQEQKRRLIEEQQIKDKKIYNIDEILTAANQRLHKVLIDAGVAECDVLSLASNQAGLRKEHDMIRLNVKNSSDIVILNRFFSAAYIHRVIDEIISNAIILEEINRKFKYFLKENDIQHQNSVHLVTDHEQLDVYLSFEENGIFSVKVFTDLELEDFGDVYIQFSKDSSSFVNVTGLDLSASFGYKKNNVAVEELADVLAEIDDVYHNLSVRSY